jgi:hypothetical protein
LLHRIHNRLFRTIFFGNYFYGLCAIALSIEASLQQKFPLNDFLFYVLIFSATVLYYTIAYLMTESSTESSNIRSAWYAANRRMMKRSQLIFLLVLFFGGSYFLFKNWLSVASMNLIEWILILIFPLVSSMYYGIHLTRHININIRNIGWLKPFVIGFTWAGLVTVYPILYYCIANGIHYEITLVGIFLFIKNFMFVTLLCIMFDFKDYAMDYNMQLKTFVVNLGVRKTIFYIIIPLCIAGLGSFLVYAVINNFHPMKIVLNTIPFLAVIAVAHSMHYRRSIFYYLVIIDGLMVLKALCGISGMLFF